MLVIGEILRNECEVENGWEGINLLEVRGSILHIQ
jgi:hypothetical protein